MMETFLKELREPFEPSVDFITKWADWEDGEQVILCYYSSLVDKMDVQRLLILYRESKESMLITVEPFDAEQFKAQICNGETVVVRPTLGQSIRFNVPENIREEPDQPTNEYVLRGSNEGFVINWETNIALLRRKMRDSSLIVKQLEIGKDTKVKVYYFYRNDVVDKEALALLEERLHNMQMNFFYVNGQMMDSIEDKVYSPFPQTLVTERPDRVIANLVEGKIAVFSELAPAAYIMPVTFFAFYESPDDYTNRVLVGSFYKLLRYASFLTALFLPAIYIATVSFHFEILPIELADKVKEDVTGIPYRPFIEAMILEITIELIREASIRLPQPVGQTIGIVGGLVIGDAIVNAGLVSNLMVIVVAFTAISSFVIPNSEMNATIRLLRFPFMLLASLMGFFGIVIGTFLLAIHLLNLSSLKRPYLEPIVPFNAKKFIDVLLSMRPIRPYKQSKTFSSEKKRNE